MYKCVNWARQGEVEEIIARGWGRAKRFLENLLLIGPRFVGSGWIRLCGGVGVGGAHPPHQPTWLAREGAGGQKKLREKRGGLPSPLSPPLLYTGYIQLVAFCLLLLVDPTIRLFLVDLFIFSVFFETGSSLWLLTFL